MIFNSIFYLKGFDKSDEVNCTTINTNRTIKPELIDCSIPSKQCIDIKTNQSICLPIENFCNNHVDCWNGVDEGGNCTKDLCFNSNCTGTCHNTPSGKKFIKYV